MESKPNIVEVMAEILNNKEKIISDFCKAYLASNADEFIKNPEMIKKIKLVIKKNNDPSQFGFDYWFEKKRGIGKKNIKEGVKYGRCKKKDMPCNE